MKRRSFLASLAGLFSLPFVPKAEAKDPMSQVTPKQKLWRAQAESLHTGKYIVAVDWARDAIELPDRHSVVLMSHRKGITP